MANRDFILNFNGNFGEYGGFFAPEMLRDEICKIGDFFYNKFVPSKEMNDEFFNILSDFCGRETPLYFAKNLSDKIGGGKIYLKREDLVFTNSHKINNAVGQILIAKKLGKSEIICETGAGQHGVATATVCAKFGLRAKVFMGSRDIERQAENVAKMKILGAEIVSIDSGSCSLKDAVSAAMQYWVANQKESYCLIGSSVGPHPFPSIVAYFQYVIGEEAANQILKKEGKMPNFVIACVGGGSNAIGIFQRFLCEKTQVGKSVKLIAVEPAGDGKNKHGMSIAKGKIGCFHGMMTKILTNENGFIIPSHSISAGLDYPAVSPIHSYLEDNKYIQVCGITDKEAVFAYKELAKTEGIIPALESSHAIAKGIEIAKNSKKDDVILINLSGLGYKDISSVEKFEK